MLAWPISFWFGGALGGYLGRLAADSASPPAYLEFAVFYATIAVVLVLLSVLGMALAFVSERLLARLW